MKKINKKHGFTLIELMVVITIIGVLSGILYTNFVSARASARDQARKVALKELQLAIELYYAVNGVYPESCRGANQWSGEIGAFGCSGGGPYIVGIVPDFIKALPIDQKTAYNKGFFYRVDAARTSYKLLSHNVVEKNFVKSYDDEFARCPQSTGEDYCGALPQANTYAVYGGPNSAGW